MPTGRLVSSPPAWPSFTFADGTFGRTEIAFPRARLDGPDGKTTEWQSKTLRAYQRRTLAADALIASTYLAGTNTAGSAEHSRRCSAVRSARTR